MSAVPMDGWIAVTAQGEGPDAAVEPRFGRTAWFVLTPLAAEVVPPSWHSVPNARAQAAEQGAGIQAALTASEAGARVVLTGHCGPKAFRVLHAAGIAVVLGLRDGTVGEAVARYRRGELHPARMADVEGHWL